MLGDFGKSWARQKEDRENGRQDALEAELQPAANAFGVFLRNLEPIVIEANCAEKQGAEEHQPDERVLHSCPQESREHDRADDQQPSHGRGAFLSPMELEELVYFLLGANRLAEFQGDQLRIVQLPKTMEIRKAVAAAQMARNVM